MITHRWEPRVLVWSAACMFLFSLLLVGCPAPFPKCRNDGDCAAEPGNSSQMKCCMENCQECCQDSDCPEDKPHCKSNKCVECTEDPDCPEDKPICEDEKCVHECEIDADCARRGKEGMICKDNKCKWECETDDDCNDPDKECKEHRCVVKCKCQTDEDCPGDKRCENCECSDKPACELETINFDFDKFDLRAGDREILDRNAKCLEERTDIDVTIAGHCDERGTTGYNVSLSDKRAKATRKYLENLGIRRARIKTIPFGEEQPVCNESNEDCWARNRRCEFKY